MAASTPGVFSTQQFTDLGGPLVGGRLYTRTYGTTAHKTAYTDLNGAIPHTYTSDGAGGQYIALNSRGELPAPLYLVSGSYDLALKRSDGSTVWTRRADPVSDAFIAQTGAGLVGFLYSLAYASGTVGKWLKDLALGTGAAFIGNKYDAPAAVALNLHEWIEDDGSYNVMGFVPQTAKSAIRERTSTVDLSTAFASCVAAVASERTYGTVKLPMGVMALNAPIVPRYGISIKGAGGLASELRFYDCDGITIQASAWDQNMSVFEDFGLKAMSGLNRTGFLCATSPYLGELDGFHLHRVRFFDWDTSIYGGAIWQSNIENCWMERTNTAIRLDGHAVLCNILKNQIIRTGGGRGSAASLGVHLGNTDIEANVVAQNFVFGFATCIALGDPWHCTVKDNTLLASGAEGQALVGIDFTTVKEHLNIVGNMVEAQSTATGTWHGIWGRATFTPSNAQTIIAQNRVWDDTSLAAGSIGIQINDGGNTNQNNVVIRDNNLTGHTQHDIAVYNPNNVVIQDNDCRSSGVPTYSLLVYGTVTGPAIARDNRCAKAIYAEPAYVLDGSIVLQDNTESGTFRGLKGSATYDPGSLADGVGTTTTVTVTGAALGDYAYASFSLDLQGITITAWVSAANTVSVRFQNESGGTLDLASGTLRARVVRA